MLVRRLLLLRPYMYVPNPCTTADVYEWQYPRQQQSIAGCLMRLLLNEAASSNRAAGGDVRLADVARRLAVLLMAQSLKPQRVHAHVEQQQQQQDAEAVHGAGGLLLLGSAPFDTLLPLWRALLVDHFAAGSGALALVSSGHTICQLYSFVVVAYVTFPCHLGGGCCASDASMPGCWIRTDMCMRQGVVAPCT